MFRLVFINVVAFAIVGMILVSLGVTILTWEFWAVIISMTVVQVNNGV